MLFKQHDGSHALFFPLFLPCLPRCWWPRCEGSLFMDPGCVITGLLRRVVEKYAPHSILFQGKGGAPGARDCSTSVELLAVDPRGDGLGPELGGDSQSRTGRSSIAWLISCAFLAFFFTLRAEKPTIQVHTVLTSVSVTFTRIIPPTKIGSVSVIMGANLARHESLHQWKINSDTR